MKKKAIIISIKGYKLTKKENELLVREKPWGLIIFKRNIKSWSQIKTLIKSIRNSTKDPKFPIMIDEEGGAVTRLNNLINFNFYNKFFGEIYKYDPKTSISSYGKYSRKIASTLKLIGININTVPVLDVIRKNTNNIIGNRSFSSDPSVVKRLGEECIKSYRLERIGTVIKHIPGHGCSSLDSHIKMPKVKNTLKDLKNIDFFPFKLQKSFFAMTAHIKYLMLDNKNALCSTDNTQVREAMKRHGIELHITPFKHKWFWDCGIHCLTQDLDRE